MDREGMLQCLRAGGVNVDTFDEDGYKSLDDLFREIVTRDVTLTNARINGRMRAVRTAFNVKVLVSSELGTLCELGRHYHVKDGYRRPVLWAFKPWGLSETRKRDETIKEAAIRGFHEEHRGLVVSEDELRPLDGPDEPDTHDSTVYANTSKVPVVSRVYTQYLAFHREAAICPSQDALPDGSDLIFVKWLNLEKGTKEQRNALINSLMKGYASAEPLITENRVGKPLFRFGRFSFISYEARARAVCSGSRTA
jgi:hypothetical protein